jgi:hypothetical protein
MSFPANLLDVHAMAEGLVQHLDEAGYEIVARGSIPPWMEFVVTMPKGDLYRVIPDLPSTDGAGAWDVP